MMFLLRESTSPHVRELLSILTRDMIVLKQKAPLHYGLPPPSPPQPPSPWSSILRGDDRRPRRRGRRVACGERVTQLRDKVTAKDSGAGAPADDETDTARSCKSLSECYFAGKGAALVLPPNERARPSRRVSAAGCDIQQHLQSMFYLLRPEETLKMAVKLESVHPGRTRYLVVVSCTGRQDAEESCLLGIDCHARATVGLVLRVLADTAITLDGDGGFKVSVCGRQHIFKPVSALQTLHKVSGKAREQNYFLGGLSHDWVSYYEQRIESDRSCLNEWHAMDNLESKRPPSPDSVRTKPREREETERVIRSTLKEIMMSVDLDEVTSKYIRGRLEEDLDMDLGEFKPFIDQEMLTILGQMDAPTEIFDHVYLGSEWNASNLEELQKNGVRHILNVTREIDNFFPGMFTYLNVRVYDDEKTDLLKHWDNTFKYITKAKMEGSKVLVHCKMGVSRSASVVIAYAMKAYNWDFSQAWKHVKEKRNCIKPNNSFLLQLETYQGILDAMKNKEKLQRSKKQYAGAELKKTSQRPKSWSPNVKVAENMLPSVPLSQSLESIDKAGNTEVTREDLLRGSNQKPAIEQEARNVLMPCDNGQSYSVSQNKIMHLPAATPGTPSVKNRISKLETQGQKRKGLVLNLTNQFEAASSKPSSPGSDTDARSLSQNSVAEDNAKPIENGHSHCEQSQEARDTAASASSVPSGKEIWDPGEEQRERRKEMSQESTEINDNSECLVWTASADATCADLCDDNKTDRSSSWSSYDSAVVLDNNSVHSSWATLPSRNSSWGSYDMRPSDLLGSSGLFPYDKEEIPWHPGTVKRTKQKLEEVTTAGEVKRVCTQSSTTADDKSDRLATEVDAAAVETYNPMLLHHMPSPTPRRRDSSPTQEHNLKVETNRDSPSPVGSIDISLMSMRQIGRLSTSAPAPSSLSSESDLPLSLRSCRSESETSSPCVVNTTQCPSVKHHKMVLENLCNKSVFSKRCLSVDDSPEAECPRSTSGIVKNLKKEFEAKSTKLERSPENACEGENASLTARPKRDVKIRSLPSSPVIPHNESKIQSSSSVGETKDSKHGRRSETTPPSSQDNAEDLSVRVLVGKYEVARPESRKSSDVQLRAHKDKDWDAMEVHPPAKSKIAPEFSRRSAPIMINNHPAPLFNEAPEAPGRPPAVPSPSVVMASVVAKAASKKQQQHGRTHPLARLQVRPRHSSPVYNTM
ncbi:Protein phosphatase Slingshot [Temnothorax longispinosus]|uniref:protein-serine/threonine phosphatase n=1 Tax=Temnothorax longispinosus TaxID=300112 RepID=A0A4S2JRV3_9HYME|nr:Protein phosphatase Slingshot [Temnothorax longispinosus]